MCVGVCVCVRVYVYECVSYMCVCAPGVCVCVCMHLVRNPNIGTCAYSLGFYWDDTPFVWCVGCVCGGVCVVVCVCVCGVGCGVVWCGVGRGYTFGADNELLC